MTSLIRFEIRNHLKLLNEFQPEVISEFCKLSHEYLLSGPNKKKYSVAAKKLSTTTDEIQSIIESLTCFTIDSIKHNLHETELSESLVQIKFQPDQIKSLVNFIDDKKSYENILKTFQSYKTLKFRDLEWRIDAKIASRACLHQATPSIIIKLHLDRENLNEHKNKIIDDTNSLDEEENTDRNQNDDKLVTKRNVLFEIDLSSLSHIITVLEEALLESKTHRTRNFIKAFQ